MKKYFAIAATACLSAAILVACGGGRAQSALVTEPIPSQTLASCKTCGVVETIRKLDAAGATPAVYAFTVRRRDESTQVSSDASAAKWHVGESIIFIGGDKPSSTTPVSL